MTLGIQNIYSEAKQISKYCVATLRKGGPGTFLPNQGKGKWKMVEQFLFLLI